MNRKRRRESFRAKKIPDVFFRYAVLLVTLGIVSLNAAPPSQAQVAPDAIVRETIAGTTVSFEMVLVPKGAVSVNGASETAGPFYIGRTEVTWDMYDVFALGLDTPESRPAGSDGIARPSNPYGAPDSLTLSGILKNPTSSIFASLNSHH